MLGLGMRLEALLDENAKKTLVDLMLKGQEVFIYSKKWGTEGLEKKSGTVLNVTPNLLIEFKNGTGEDEYRHFCGPARGIALITSLDEKVLFYKNMRVLDIQLPVKDDNQRAGILKAGEFYIYPEYLPKEVRF